LKSRFDARERIPDLSQFVALFDRYRLEVVNDHADKEIQGDESAKRINYASVGSGLYRLLKNSHGLKKI
jgi:hypothetical protein